MAKCPIREIAKQAGDAGIPFLVIGGYAVFAHGYVRATDDLDLIVQRGRRAQLGKLLGDLGMTVKNDAANFVQFDPPDENGMDVDLMFVSEDVFGRLEQAAVKATVEGTQVRVVSLLHLICSEVPRAATRQILAPTQRHGRSGATQPDQSAGLE